LEEKSPATLAGANGGGEEVEKMIKMKEKVLEEEYDGASHR
jgi:hypothetical protein